MGQAINDIRHMLDLADLLRQDAQKDECADRAAKLVEAAALLEQRADNMATREGYAFL